LPKPSSRLLYICLSTDIYMLLLTIHPKYISNQNSQSRYLKKLVTHWCILSYIIFAHLYLLVSIALTVTNTLLAYNFLFRVGRINLATFGAALTSPCCGHTGSSMRLSCSISDLMSAAQSCLLSVGLSTSPFQLSQSSESETLSSALSSSHLTDWRLFLQIRQTFNIWVCPPWMFFADKAGGKGDLSNN
jgi:hypothetical protein